MLLAGVSNTLAFAPFSIWLIAFITPVVFLLFIEQASPKQAAWLGFAYGIGWFGAGISWVHVSLDLYGGLPLIGSLFLMLLLVSYLALFPALFSYILQRFISQPQWRILAIPTLWLCTEYLRGTLLTGFPWLTLGYSQLKGPFSGIAPIMGEVAISYFILLCSALIVAFVTQPHYRKNISGLLVSLITITIVSSQLSWTKNTEEKANIVLVQGNIKQELRWAPEQEWPTMLKYLDLTRPYYSNADLIIWPEAAIPQLEPLAQDFLDSLDKSLIFNNTALVTGITDYQRFPKAIYNNLVVVGKKFSDDEKQSYYYGHGNRYSKHHLLPIGEFVPFEDWLRNLAPIFDLPMSSFTRGDYQQPSLVANGYQLTPAICFEVAFSSQVLANFKDDTDFLLTVSNDAWFGQSHGPHQHLEIAQMRALELGRPFLRATNTGITAVINAKGEVIKQLPQFKEGVLTTEVSLVKGMTPFARYGHTPIIVLVIAGIFLLIIQYITKNSKRIAKRSSC